MARRRDDQPLAVHVARRPIAVARRRDDQPLAVPVARRPIAVARRPNGSSKRRALYLYATVATGP